MATKRFAYVFAAVGFTFACGSSDGGETPPAGTGGVPVGQGGALVNTGGLPPATGGFTPSTGGALATGGQIAGTGGAGGVAAGGTSSGGAGGAASGGTSSGGAASGGSGGGAPVEKKACLTDAKQIALMGDSYVNWGSHTFPADINAASGLTIGNFAVGATSMGSGGFGDPIPKQLDKVLAAQPNIRTIILDGGGNDVLVPDLAQFPQGGDCKMRGAESPSIPDCQKIVEKALAAGRALFMRMAQVGIKDAVFFFYPIVPTGTLVGGTDPNAMNDYARPKIKADCDGAYAESLKVDPAKPIRCHFVDMVPVFAGQTGVFADADIHPNPKGSKLMADAVWAKMKQECIAQPASSGCCTP